MTTYASRREFLRSLGIGAAAMPFVLNLPSLGFAGRRPRAGSGWSSCSAPTASSPITSGPMKTGDDFTLKESLKPLEALQKRTLVLHGISDKIRGDGDNHMRGIGCLLTGTELFPGNIQGGSDTPAGWSKGISIDQEIKNFLQANPDHPHAVRLARIRRDGARPGRHRGRACRTPARTSRSRRSTTRTKCSPSSTGG